MGSLLFRNARLVLPPGRGCETGDLLISDDRIAAIGSEISPSDVRTQVVDCDGDFLIPGLVDIHVHGAMGHDAMEAMGDAFAVILSHLARRGTTTALLSSVSASREEIARLLQAAAHHRDKEGEARFQGIHLEGPYFSPVMRGAHRSDVIRNPSAEETLFLLEHLSPVRRVTLAPELPGALSLMEELVVKGVSVSAGHSNATEKEAQDGFAKGITQVTHLYNAMSSLRKDAGGRVVGLAETALTTPGILCELIADGVHLPPALLRLAWLAKGWEEIALVSDATAGAGLPVGSLFELGGLTCRVEAGASWTGEGNDRRLAGSTTFQIDGIRTMVERCGVPLVEAVAMASLVPARSLGLGADRGSLEVGKRADLIRLGPDWSIKGVWIGGVSVTGGRKQNSQGSVTDAKQRPGQPRG
jgi:N-acetylglucosamine-6-phosphate deacetylase